MADSILGSVIEHLSHDDDAVRNIALNWLCEGYMDDTSISQVVFDQWSQRSPEIAFTQFPMLSFFPIPSSTIGHACLQVADLVGQERELTSITTRSAGKLLEQVVKMPITELAEHEQQIVQTAQSHKIFFRIDIQGLRQRVGLLDKSADQLAGVLDQAVAELAENPESATALQQGLAALEVLRHLHPGYLDLSAVLSCGPGVSTADSASFQMVLISLAQFAGNQDSSEQGLESKLAVHLQDSRESVLSLVLEALVRCGSGAAAQALLEQFPQSTENNRRWIARGLQRMRVAGLAPMVQQLRASISDPGLWAMLLVAEMQQLDPRSGQSIVAALDEIETASQVMIDAGLLYTFVCAPWQPTLRPTQVEQSYRDFLMRVQANLTRMTAHDGHDKRALRKHQNKQIDQLFKKRRKI
ncbi:MAG: hypothetical protein KF752_16665 [Pirellulaceae bacterium]|nr:hypothetical protein [Pirellulaceae bacterium]